MLVDLKGKVVCVTGAARRVGRAIGLRVTPELRFEYDTVPDTAARVDRLLREGTPRDEDEE